ncbi:hypothetical protein [Streptomyces sp. SID3343]|uniref:hypothetical protein n=1 Tax=Streptomyces sp. SID3343 TaxID=2690260 RepID=UPI00136DD3C0|nr:hypothetical protein [Streptomyces sp. SID3343]MYV99193.1 hypothetical protein [Streptomyces sp. SID3343]
MHSGTVDPEVRPQAAPDPEVGHKPGARRRFDRAAAQRALPAVASIAAGTALVGWHASRYGRWIVDDAAITYVYARNIAEGHGPVFQPGDDPVEGFSNPLWTLILVIGRWLGLFDRGTLFGVPDYVLFPKAFALLTVVVILTCAYLMTSTILRRGAWIVPLAVGALFTLSPSFVIWMFSGLENPLYVLCAVLLATILTRSISADRLTTVTPAVAAGLCAAAAGLTRPDGALYAAAYPVVVLLFVTRDTWRRALTVAAVSCAVFFVPYLGYVAWRRIEFGRWVPNTAVAKSQETPDWVSVNKVVELLGVTGWLLAAVVLICVGMTLTRPGPARRPLVGLLVPFVLSAAAVAILSPDWMGQFRFATPLWALGAMIAVLCVIEQVRRADLRGRVVIVFATCLAIGTTATIAGDNRTLFRHDPTTPLCLVADMRGKAFNTYADVIKLGDQGTYLGPDMGGFGLTTRLHIFDLAGLVDAPIADYLYAKDHAGLRDYVLEKVKPTFIDASTTWGGDLIEDPRLGRDYEKFWTTRNGGHWVRKDAVTPERLTELLRVAKIIETRELARVLESPRASCGSTLRRGQTLPY